MKKICAITMVRDDEFFLRKWISYYGSQLGEENLYVLFDGEDQRIPDFCGKANTIIHKRVKGMVAKADKGRIDLISEKARELMKDYDIVIGMDVDEFLVVDPLKNMSLAQYLGSIDIGTTVSGLGVDVGQHLDKEQPIDASRPFLEQRRYGYLYPRYTKTSVIGRPVQWGAGFHRVLGHNYHIDPNLYLFHFGGFDMAMLEAKMKDQDRLANGWSRHMKKRARTMLLITKRKTRKWERTVPVVRGMQRIFRPIFAWNKPTVFGLQFIVEIPERFGKVL